jgi:hypothetical protein
MAQVQGTIVGNKSSSNYTMMDEMLLRELSDIDGVRGINPETGRDISDGGLLSGMSTRLFGAPFQLLDSVDHRFPNINRYVGNEYLRNFLLNSPILYIHPGLPRYTGGKVSELATTVMDSFNSNLGPVRLMVGLAKGSIFGSGSKLQRRMFGFKQTYLEYMQYVNYMCRSSASYLGLTDIINDSSTHSKKITGIDGTFVSDTSKSGSNSSNPKYVQFSKIKWQNYRFLGGYVQTTKERIDELINAAGGTISDGFKGLFGLDSDENGNQFFVKNIDNMDAFENLNEGNMSINETMDMQLTSVAFMVEPVSFTESLDNETSQSMLESITEKIDGIGSEMAFITGSRVDVGTIGSVLGFLGNTVADGASQIASLVSTTTGGFVTNLFQGAIGALKGQKMIYPEIYRSSRSSMDYEFNVTLTSPYGDAYNYYMHIVVPLLHLIGLAAPRMVSANSTASPFLVQAYIPGMCTCQLGIISKMTITKNPDNGHVSVDGFPLTVKVNFTIKELYNALAISPANDPVSFLYNETLNDYLANISGLVPSLATYETKQKALFKNLEEFFTVDSFVNSALSGGYEWVESKVAR